MKRVFAEYLISRGLIAGTSLEGIPDLNWNSSEPIGRLALLHNLLEPSSIDEVLERQRTARHLFGEVAVQMKLLRPEHLEVLLHGQGARSCIELIEDLALARLLDVQNGLNALG